MDCSICSGIMALFARVRMLEKYDVQYFQCKECGFTQTETPYWLEDAYATAITDSDVGLVGRNLSFATITQSVIRAFFDADAKFVDYGGGYGLFVRLMRDAGYDFYRSDKHCQNLFSKHFEADMIGRGQYELLTAIEVFEHLVNPSEEMEQMMGYSRNILFTTILLPAQNPKPNEWWYYGLEHGQHVSFYTQRSLEMLAKHFGLRLYTNGTTLHLLTDKSISWPLFRLACNLRFARLTKLLRVRKSLIANDYVKITKKG